MAPLDTPQLAGFVARVAEINALADAAPGFVWRFQTDDGDSTSVRPYGDGRVLVNFSVLESPEALREFVYHTAHAELLRRRREWFEGMTDSHAVLWWVLAHHRPTVDEAVDRLEWLRVRGESAEAFSNRNLHPSHER